jgi:hypothetical protein
MDARINLLISFIPCRLNQFGKKFSSSEEMSSVIFVISVLKHSSSVIMSNIAMVVSISVMARCSKTIVSNGSLW